MNQARINQAVACLMSMGFRAFQIDGVLLLDADQVLTPRGKEFISALVEWVYEPQPN